MILFVLSTSQLQATSCLKGVKKVVNSTEFSPLVRQVQTFESDLKNIVEKSQKFLESLDQKQIELEAINKERGLKEKILWGVFGDSHLNKKHKGIQESIDRIEKELELLKGLQNEKEIEINQYIEKWLMVNLPQFALLKESMVSIEENVCQGRKCLWTLDKALEDIKTAELAENMDMFTSNIASSAISAVNTSVADSSIKAAQRELKIFVEKINDEKIQLTGLENVSVSDGLDLVFTALDLDILSVYTSWKNLEALRSAAESLSSLHSDMGPIIKEHNELLSSLKKEFHQYICETRELCLTSSK